MKPGPLRTERARDPAPQKRARLKKKTARPEKKKHGQKKSEVFFGVAPRMEQKIDFLATNRRFQSRRSRPFFCVLASKTNKTDETPPYLKGAVCFCRTNFSFFSNMAFVFSGTRGFKSTVPLAIWAKIMKFLTSREAGFVGRFASECKAPAFSAEPRTPRCKRPDCAFLLSVCVLLCHCRIGRPQNRMPGSV